MVGRPLLAVLYEKVQKKHACPPKTRDAVDCIVHIHNNKQHLYNNCECAQKIGAALEHSPDDRCDVGIFLPILYEKVQKKHACPPKTRDAVDCIVHYQKKKASYTTILEMHKKSERLWSTAQTTAYCRRRLADKP